MQDLENARGRMLASVFLSVAIASACGGGRGSSDSPPPAPTPAPTPAPAPAPVVADVPSSAAASRFLTQATFGPTQGAIDGLASQGYSAWFAAEFAKPQTLMLPVMQANENAGLAAGRGAISGLTDLSGFCTAWWPQAVRSDDQLRQRATFALSELFVISFQDDNVKYLGLAAATYYDMQGNDAFGNFRTLLQDVTLHPLMGSYLSWVNNRKEVLDAAGNIVHEPDENYAREVMQLFTIGLNQLNIDGTPKLDAKGAPIPTYSHDDIYAIARVLTGWNTDNSVPSPLWVVPGKNGVPLIPQAPGNHSTSEKTFLGVTIPASNTATADSMRSELKVLLDTLFNHPNVAPFVSKQLIQRLVTSNPSPAYVKRVASIFNDNGAGLRGDMKAVWRAVLMDPEAHATAGITDPHFGKVREPLLRMTNWMRAFGASQSTATFAIGSTSDAGTSLGMSPMNSPSVFNFFAPGYSPSNSATGAAGLLAPELQITDEQSVIGYQNLMRQVIQAGSFGGVPVDTSAELALTEDAGLDALMNRVDLLLMEGQMPAALKSQVKAAVASIKLQKPAGTPQGDAERKRRLWTAVYLSMASPEYLVQK